jgi:hypothetical protein
MNYLEKLKNSEDEDPRTREWLIYWRELAPVTNGITRDDPSFEPVMRWLNICETAFLLDSWVAFQEAATEVKRIARGA